MKILIVEDESALSLVLAEKFRDEGYIVEIVEDGEVVLEKTEQFRPSIILLDLILPKKYGLDVLQDLKNNPEFKSIPVIVLSNLEGDETIKKALLLGAVDYFVKTQHPVAEIVERVEKYIRKPNISEK